MKIPGKRARSISAIFDRISLPLIVPVGLFLMGAQLSVLAPPTVQNPSVALEGFTGLLDVDRLTRPPRPGLLVLFGALVLICATPWGRILQAVRKRK
jgi:hypothetical protein